VVLALALTSAGVLAVVDSRRDAAAERAVRLSVVPGFSHLDAERRWITRVVNSGPDRVTITGSRLVAPGFPPMRFDAPVSAGEWAELQVLTDWACSPALYDTRPDTLEVEVVTHRGTTTQRRVRLLDEDATRLDELVRGEECGLVRPEHALGSHPTSAVADRREIHLELAVRNVGRFDTITVSDPRTLPGITLVGGGFPLVLQPNDSGRGGPDELRLDLVLRVDDCSEVRRAGLSDTPTVVVRVDNGREQADATLEVDDQSGDHPRPGEPLPPSGSRLVQEICETPRR